MCYQSIHVIIVTNLKQRLFFNKYNLIEAKPNFCYALTENQF